MSQYAKLIEHAGSLGIGYGATGRADVLAEYREAKAAALDAISALERELDEAREDAILDAIAELIATRAMSADQMRLQGGEQTVQEIRTAKAWLAYAQTRLERLIPARTALASKP